MKLKFALFAGMMFILALAVTSCNDDEGDGPPTGPTLTLAPNTPIEFSAAATESIEITVSTNQPSWDAVSSQEWCKIAKSGNKFTVTATPNSTTSSPTPVVITVSAGKATNVTIAVTQLAATEATYPTTEDALKSAITKVWTFPERSEYISLEFGSEKTYTLLSKEPLARATAKNIYLLSGKYTISSDLRTLTLSEFGAINISTIKNGKIEMTMTPTGGLAVPVELDEQKFIDPPVSPGKKIKKSETFDEEDGNSSVSYSYTNNKLTLLEFRAGLLSIDIPITYQNNTVFFQFEGRETIGKEGIFKVTYTLNAVGLAQSSIIEHKGVVVGKTYYTYDNLRQLISYRLTDNVGKFIQSGNATWSGGNVIGTYTERAHTCDDSFTMDGDTKIYHHDHNGNGVFDSNDIIKLEKSNKSYSYSDKINKGGYMSSIVMPEIFYSTDVMDQFGQWIGVLGVSCKNTMSQHEHGDGNLAYTFDSEGYPTRIDVTYPPATPGAAWHMVQTFE